MVAFRVVSTWLDPQTAATPRRRPPPVRTGSSRLTCHTRRPPACSNLASPLGWAVVQERVEGGRGLTGTENGRHANSETALMFPCVVRSAAGASWSVSACRSEHTQLRGR